MSHLRNPRLRKGATLATAMLVGATIFAVATTARGASHRAQAATLDLTQTCSNRVEPGSSISIQATVQNTGDEVLLIPPPGPDADAGTPDNGDGRLLPHVPERRQRHNWPTRPGRDLDVRRLVHGPGRGRDEHRRRRRDLDTGRDGRQRHRAVRDRRHPAGSSPAGSPVSWRWPARSSSRRRERTNSSRSTARPRSRSAHRWTPSRGRFS